MDGKDRPVLPQNKPFLTLLPFVLPLGKAIIWAKEPACAGEALPDRNNTHFACRFGRPHSFSPVFAKGFFVVSRSRGLMCLVLSPPVKAADTIIV
jgi:hypothetical protein